MKNLTCWKVAFLLAPIIFSGCSNPPKIWYMSYKKNDGTLYPDYEGLVQYNLAASVLLIDKSPNEPIKIISTPVESEKLLVLRPADSWGTTTHLKVKKIPNTNLIQQIDVEVEDKRKVILEQLGSAGAAIASFGIFTAGDAELPLAIDTQILLLPENPKKFQVNGIVENPNNAFSIEVGPVPIGSMPYDSFMSKASVEKQSVLVYSACRQATVVITAGGSKVKFSTMISDPSFVQVAAFPAKGSVSMHSACGTDTSGEAGSIATSTELFSTFISQAKAVREARQTKKNQ